MLVNCHCYLQNLRNGNVSVLLGICLFEERIVTELKRDGQTKDFLNFNENYTGRSKERFF